MRHRNISLLQVLVTQRNGNHKTAVNSIDQCVGWGFFQCSLGRNLTVTVTANSNQHKTGNCDSYSSPNVGSIYKSRRTLSQSSYARKMLASI